MEIKCQCRGIKNFKHELINKKPFLGLNFIYLYLGVKKKVE